LPEAQEIYYRAYRKTREYIRALQKGIPALEMTTQMKPAGLLLEHNTDNNLIAHVKTVSGSFGYGEVAKLCPR
jgi:hypothetical protein